jgi:hypothetical protein
MVNLEKVRITQAADLASIPGTTADTILFIDRSTVINTGTIPFPSNPIDGQIYMISSRIDIISVTLSTNGRPVSGAITSLSSGDFVGWIYDTTSNRWGPYGQQTKTDIDLLAYQSLGSPILAETVGQKLQYANVATNMVDGQIKYTAVYLPKFATLTGMKVYVRTVGNYTGDNNNRVGLYTYDGSNGTLTLVASSVNNASLWTSGANAVMTVPFSATYDAVAGIYFVGYLYNQSAQVTAPALASCVALNNLAMAGAAMGFTNSAKLHGTSLGTDLPASILSSAITASAIASWVAVY